MRGHLVIFAEILSSNQILWDSFSPLEKNRHLNKNEYMQGTKEGTDENKQVKKHHQQSNNKNTFFLSVVRMVALSWSCSWE